MTRNKKMIVNCLSGAFRQLVGIVCGFILPRLLLEYYGSGVNGLVSSISNFLGFIVFLDMGVGPVVKTALYKPLANKDSVEISKIYVFAKKFYRKIAIALLGYVILLAFIYPLFVNGHFDTLFTVSLIVIISISSFAEYFFGAVSQLLLSADQKSFISLWIQTILTVVNCVICVILIRTGSSIQSVKLISSTIFIINPLILHLYIKRNYTIDCHVVLDEEPIQQKWNAFAQHIAAVISNNVDVFLLTIFSVLENVSVYTVYYMVVGNITNLLMSAATGLESYFGNMLAQNERKVISRSFAKIESICHMIATIVFSITAITIVPFIRVYTESITDVDYFVPGFGLLLVFAYWMQCLRIPYFRIIKAAGHYKETQNGAFISLGINIVVSLCLVIQYGLIGTAIGTLLAMLFHTVYFVWYLRRNILSRKVIYFLSHFCVDLIVFIVAYVCTRQMSPGVCSYWAWICYAIKISCITVLISVVLNVPFFLQKRVRIFHR